MTLEHYKTLEQYEIAQAEHINIDPKAYRHESWYEYVSRLEGARMKAITLWKVLYEIQNVNISLLNDIDAQLELGQ